MAEWSRKVTSRTQWKVLSGAPSERCAQLVAVHHKAASMAARDHLRPSPWVWGWERRWRARGGGSFGGCRASDLGGSVICAPRGTTAPIGWAGMVTQAIEFHHRAAGHSSRLRAHPVALDRRPTPRLTSESRASRVTGACSDTPSPLADAHRAIQRPNAATPSTYQLRSPGRSATSQVLRRACLARPSLGTCGVESA